MSYKKTNGILKFIRAERNQGTSKKTGNDFDISSLTLSDGDESFPVDVKPELVEEMNTQLRKGDFIEVTFEISQSYRGTTHTVDSYKKVNTFAKAN